MFRELLGLILGNKRVCRHPSRHRTRLSLERLEDRLTLDAYIWQGVDNGEWRDVNNWRVGGLVPNRAPAAGDDVTFNNQGLTNSVVEQAYTIRNLTIDAAWSQQSLL